ncbi:MAG: phosphoglycerate kinase [Thermoplasmata archaeon]|nr:MAG: phosphoglycerate kinase [Thermoplasmata archaeon]
MKLPTLDDVDVDGKVILTRVDINSPLHPETLDILDTSRIKRIIPTLHELEKGKVVLLAHQGRPGSWDFTGLEKHAHAISNELGKDVAYIDDIYGEKAQKAIKELKEGEVLLLDNVRKYKGEREKKSPEEHALSPLVKNLAPLADIFVNDAFAAAHRPHCSLVGFIPVLPSYAGRLLEMEVKTLTKIMEMPERPCVFIFGGAKYSNAVKVIKNLVGKKIADKILLGGVPGSAFLKAKGVETSIKMERDEREEMEEILEKFGNHIVLPVDFVVNGDGIKEKDVTNISTNDEIGDIGNETISLFTQEIKKASTLFLSGPMGIFEKKEFEKGTKEILESIANSKSFSIIGGGHTVAAANRFGVADKMSYISTGGGSLEQFLMGKPLPVIEALAGKVK